MATRFYFPSSGTAAVSPTISTTDWGHIEATPARYPLLTTPDSSALGATGGSAFDSADHSVSMNALAGQWVSDPLAAQTFSGNVTAQIQIREFTANDNLFLTVKV